MPEETTAKFRICALIVMNMITALVRTVLRSASHSFGQVNCR